MGRKVHATMKNKEKKAYIVSHAHWDREWRYPIWQTRKDLERMFSKLIELLENEPRYQCFVTDSQVVIIEDYLQIKPEDKNRIKDLVKSGRLEIGPWYSLPEYYPLDGECIVRNLLIGDRVCEKYGGAMKVGYTTFGWGQPSQMPQIYDNFGIEVVLGGKNLDSSRTKHNEFIWEGSDGTRILANKLGVQGRANFYKFVVIPIVFGKENVSNDWRFDWDNMGVVFHHADIDSYWQDYHRYFRSTQDVFDKTRVKAAIDNSIETTNGTALPNHLILFDGGDFTFPQPMLCDIIDHANNIYDDIEFIHCPLKHYADAFKINIDKKNLSLVKGEWRDGPEPNTSANALAFRPDLKRANRIAQRALINIAEPVSCIAKLLNGLDNQPYIDLAWRYLLKSHCHDSLHGVVQDKTARDNIYRMEQVNELASVVTDSSLQAIIENVKINGDDKDVALIVFNPHPFDTSQIVKAVIDTPVELNARELSLIDPDGNEVVTEMISVEEVKVAVSEEDSRPWPYFAHRHVIEFETGLIPALGYKTYVVKITETMNPQIASWPNPPPEKNVSYQWPRNIGK